ncbi:MAG TPA: glycogen synthase GlgA [Verrucomicrobiota bacterium]|nr:glycogen synthase GlgA [Verrucomicrobiota bacterium]
MNRPPLRLLHATSELHPFSKTGGLADMVGALAQSLARAGHHVQVVTPLYRNIRPRFPALRPAQWRFDLSLGGANVSGEFWRLDPEPRLTLWFVDQPSFFDRPGIYNEHQIDYPDNAARYAFFSRAAALLARHLPEPPQIVHAHDWQTGLLPVLLHQARVSGAWSHVPESVLTVHNLAYQGWFPAEQWNLSGLPASWLHLESALHYGQVNFLKGGLALASALTTVSPTYAREICTPEYGCGLDGLLRRREYELTGILNGVDYTEWNTTNNPALPCPYDAEHLAGKAANKARLQQEMGLPREQNVPLITNITRLVEQKGADLLLTATRELLSAGERLQFVLLGSGDPKLEAGFESLAREFPQSAAVRIGFDQQLSHRIEAGADFFAMPSRFEPCGLNQMYSLRYGTVPVVRGTGGLQDSVIDPRENHDGATGIKFHDATSVALANALRKAIALFAQPEALNHFRQNGMHADLSWTRQAARYVELYEEVLHGV